MSDTPADQTPAEQNWPVQPERLRPPATPAQLLRASDADRDEVAHALGIAFAEGRLTRLEHDERLSQAMAAKTLGELAPLTHDLRPVSAAAPAASGWGTPTGTHRTQSMVAVFSGDEQKGVWNVPANINAFAMFGGLEIDMRDAVFEADEITVNVSAIFGGVELTVPRGVRVIKETFAMFGGVSIKQVGEYQPGAPTIRLRGLALFGGVDVKGRDRTVDPGPSRRELR